MFTVDVTHDVEAYQETVVAGLNKDQTKVALIFVVIFMAVGCFLYFILKLPVIIAVYGSMVISMPLGFQGFSKKNNMSFFQKIRKRFDKTFDKPITYSSNRILCNITVVKDEGDDKTEFEVATKRVKLIGIGMLVVLVVTVLVMIFLLKIKGA